MDKRVGLWVRVGDAEEVLVGTAKSVRDVPGLLDALAEQLRSGMASDVLETGTETNPFPES